jgi:hypothetical protein
MEIMRLKLNNGRQVIFNLIIDSTFNRSIYIGNEYYRHDHPILPTEIHDNGYMTWSKNNIWHRIGKPAVIYPDGKFEYLAFPYFTV